ncbi:SymE family type I addiction module toxin [Kosakonia cowanii]|uniref:SymE family type I addiction module toxin n=1 Tax=Kosakonia cowanii TaxID=208223 RepID=UPI0028964833|nr:SymE family type I addiction module toxin [Kosakonia cowanii]
MAELDTGSQQGHATTTTVCERQAHYYRVGQPNPLPLLTLKGRWLEAPGFCTYQAVMVAAENGRRIIKPQRKI